MEKGGLTTALAAVGVAATSAVYWADEMRIGLLGQVRRRWTPCGVKLRQRVSFGRVWRYLVLAVDGSTGVIHWTWIENMKGASIATAMQTFKERGIAAVVWDRAGGHRTIAVREVGVRLVEQPAASPELNPAERVFEELRRKIEGTTYEDIAAKMAAVEKELVTLAADPVAVQRLAGWEWIRAAREALSLNTASP